MRHETITMVGQGYWCSSKLNCWVQDKVRRVCKARGVKYGILLSPTIGYSCETEKSKKRQSNFCHKSMERSKVIR